MDLKIELAVKQDILKGKDLLIVNDIQAILTHWRDINSEYTRNHPKDYLFKYTEMSVVGSLVAAISRCEDMFSLLEFQTSKHKLDESDAGFSVYTGRGDLYFGRKEYGAVLEAKYPASSGKVGMAVRDITSHSSDDYNYYVALTVCKPSEPKAVIQDNFTTDDKTHMASIHSVLMADETLHVELLFLIFRSNISS